MKEQECTLSQEVLSILQQFSEANSIPMEVVDVKEVTEDVEDFNEALTMFTNNRPPVLFYKKKYIANYLDIVKANRFDRLDLIINPPLCPMYHIVIVGSGPGAQSVVTEVERFGSDLKVALVEWVSPVPYETEQVLGIGPQGNLPRKLVWAAIREAQQLPQAGLLLSDEDLLESEAGDDIWDYATYSLDKEIIAANWNFRKRLAA
ncbi:uncharacterized protein, partial [Halyomorpha halys]|uniref:uncharacterized protein n=1 Tax=Halyomorpha halys TaxID=286706 RepID=UPI000D0C7CD5